MTASRQADGGVNKLPPDVVRRSLLLGALSLAASGCAASPALQALLPQGKKKKAYTFKELKALPYATMGVRVGKSAQAVVVLARRANDDLHWVSANQVEFITHRGRLIRTNGLIKDLKTTRFGSADPVQTGLHRLEDGANLVRFMDLRPVRDIDKDVAATSVFQPLKDEVITILDRAHVTLRVEERVSYWRWNWHVKNQYWVDPGNGFVWKSVQHIAPQIGALELEIFKPAAKPRA